MNKFLLILFTSFLFFNGVVGQPFLNKIYNTQQLNINSKKENPFMFKIPEELSNKKELLDKRDMTSKHFLNEDGSLTAILAAGPLHYNENGKWKDINHEIIPTSNSVYSYANTTNLFESYFGATSNNGVKNKTIEGEVKEFLNLKMYWEVAGQTQTITNAANVPVSINGDKAYYNNLYGNINAEFTIASGRRKLNYIIPNIQALSTIPTNADYLVFQEDVILPQNWTYQVHQQKGILLKDASGKTIYAYENPNSTDANDSLDRNVNTIMEASLSGNTLTILTKVKTSWLLDANRQFPIKVDPTVNVSPDNTTNWTRSVYDDGYNEAGLFFGYYQDAYYPYYYWLKGFAKFNSSSIPTTGVTVNSVIGYINVIDAYTAWNGPWQFADAADPTTTSGLTLYNSPTLGYSTISSFNSLGWKSSTFYSPAGNTFIENELLLGRINLSIIPAGTFSNGQYYEIANHTSTNRPYLAINYTLPAGPPTCATLIEPANGAIEAIAPPKWNAVAGATGYDVYFGTASNPPLVSSNQSGTEYIPSYCLLPGTTYYWKVVPKNANGDATGCAIWSFTSATKILVYRNDWEDASTGTFPTSGTAVDSWVANNNSGIYISGSYYQNLWTVGNGPNAISGNSIGMTGLVNNSLAGNHFDYWTDLGILYRQVHRPIDLTGLRDIEVSFNWKGEGEMNVDFGEVASSIDGGTTWNDYNQGGPNNDGRYWGSPNTVQSQSITLPASRNNQSNFMLGFKWNDVSGNGFGGANSFIVDDILVKACPYEGIVNSDKTASGIFEWEPTGNTTTTLTINGSHTCAQYEWEQSIDNGTTWTSTVGGSGATTKSYTTPNNISTETWYRCKVYYGTGCSGVYQDEIFKIIPPTTLPVSWLNISATCLEKETKVEWSTATEINNDYFEIYASANGVDFDNVGKIDGAGNSSQIKNYSFYIEKETSYKYFKVKQIDFDGQFEYSKIITSNCMNSSNNIEIYPNPFNGNIFYISTNEDVANLNVKVYDLTGKLIEIANTTTNGKKLQISLSKQLVKGVYFVEIHNNQGFVTMKKLISK